MQFSLKKLCVREDSRPLPSFSAMFPAATSTQNASEPPPVDASMTLGGLPPLRQTEVMVKTEQIDDDDDDNDNDIAGDSNEIVTAFASLDAEAEATDGELPVEFRCRYRRGKCSQPRTLKKNGSMHSYCEHHRLLSIRNQRVFDQKRRRSKN
ncbi:Heat shock protein70 [Phytophthora cinnamomi]|uniref:Heat shock protein70 n=1 Tax=Phytophthora cinnamomi TaxID=4785 RepID=UPI003559672F|nr:Heat shock protein70 [Phytophthora cinnamomi]